MHSGPRCDLPVAVSTEYRKGPDIPGAAIAGLKRVTTILSVGEPSDISFTFITAAKKAAELLCIRTAGSSPPIRITPHVSREQRYQGGAAIWLSEDAIDHLSWVWCIRANVNLISRPAWKSSYAVPPASRLNRLNGPRQQLFVVFLFPPVAKICSVIRWKSLNVVHVTEGQ